MLTLQRRLEEALEEIDAAVPLDPTNSSAHSIRGGILERLTCLQEAEDAYRRALELSIDNEAAFDGLLRIQHDHAHRQTTLKFLYDQLVSQTTYGEALLAYGSYASTVFPPEQVLAQLQAASRRTARSVASLVVGRAAARRHGAVRPSSSACGTRGRTLRAVAGRVCRLGHGLPTARRRRRRTRRAASRFGNQSGMVGPVASRRRRLRTPRPIRRGPSVRRAGLAPQPHGFCTARSPRRPAMAGR
ncbi:MAG: hypothetical protein QM775_02145 [Pirellulales bacterium]